MSDPRDEQPQPLTLPGEVAQVLAARQPAVESAEYVNAALPLAWAVWFVAAPHVGTSPAYGALSNLPALFWILVCLALGVSQYLSLYYGSRRVRRHVAGLAAAFWLFVLVEIVTSLPGSFLVPCLAVSVARCVWFYVRQGERA